MCGILLADVHVWHPSRLTLGLMMEAEYGCIKLACSTMPLPGGPFSPSLRLFFRELPAYAFHKPWAAASLA
jgi:hypothetical protein